MNVKDKYKIVKSIKDVCRIIIPKPFRRLANRYFYWKKFGLEESKNLELKDKHLGKRAFIIGNGPSILNQDLTRLSNEVTFVLNSFFYHPQYEQISPTYLCNCDPVSNYTDFRKNWYELQKEKTKKTIKLFSKRQFKDEMQRYLMKQRILRKECDSQEIFSVCG